MRNRLGNLIGRLREGAGRAAAGVRNAVGRVFGRRATSPARSRSSGT